MKGECNMKQKILEATINIFKKKGLKFTMDDIAKELSISKKTIYTVFETKEELFMFMVDNCFEKIKESEDKIYVDESLDTISKLRAIMSVMPDSYTDIDFRLLYPLREKYPKVYARIQERLEGEWDKTVNLIKQGQEEGVIREFNISVFMVMMEATLEKFLERDVLIVNNVAYTDALNQIVDIMIDGIKK